LASVGVLVALEGAFNRNDPYAVVLGILYAAGGGVLIFFVQRYLSRRKLTAEMALQMLREDGKINALDLAHRVGVFEVDVRGCIPDAQRALATGF